MNQRPFRTLFLWMIWAATALIVYVTLYRDTGVWEFLEQDTSRITWLILGLFLLGLIASFILTIILTFESLAGLSIEDQVHKSGLKSLDIKNRKRAVNRFFISLKDTLSGSGEPDVEALLNVELAVYQRLSHSIEVVGNLLITLGLIGTVMGLTLTLTGLTSSLDALGHNQELLLSGLRKAMAGMGTAFYTTLLGAVLGGILLRVFAQITDHGVDGLFDRIMRLCLVYCAADLRATMERDIRFLDQEIEMLGNHVRQLHGVFEKSTQAMNQFRNEVRDLMELSRADNQEVAENIRLRRRQAEILQEEARLIRDQQKPWWQKLKEFIGLR